jgi:divalent metal cation (Fe/Co/Zn/Cd) transporter
MNDSLRAALRISWLTIAWSTVSGVISVVLGVAAGSLALVGSGASVLVDVSSSVVLVWRFRHPHGHGAAEHRAQRVAALALLTLGCLLGLSSVYRLSTGGAAHPNAATIAIAVAAVVILPLLAARKYVIAPRVPSRALTTDAHITLVGAATALLTLVGLALTNAGHPAADAAAALTIALCAAVVAYRELH